MSVSFFNGLFSVLHSLSYHSLLLSPPPVPLSPASRCRVSLALFSAGPAHTDGRKGGANGSSHAHSPRAGNWAAVTAARGVTSETATAPCRGDITSESCDSRGARVARFTVSFTSITRYASLMSLFPSHDNYTRCH